MAFSWVCRSFSGGFSSHCPWLNFPRHPCGSRRPCLLVCSSAGVFLSTSNCLCVCPLDSQGGFYRHRNGHGGWLARVVLKNATVGCENRSASPHISPWAQAQGWSLRQGPCLSLPSTSLPTSCIITIRRYIYNAIYICVYNIYTIMCIYNLSVDIMI